MPFVIELRLKAERPAQPDTRQLHGLACALFAAHGAQESPFSVWPLNPAAPRSAQEWKWRAAWLPGEPPPEGLLAPAKLRLGHVTCAVTEVTHRLVTHAHLAAGPPLESARLAFSSPTYFSQNGTDTVLPDPRLILGSWRRRWNASLADDDPLAIGEEGWREIHRAARLAEFDLHTQRMDSGRGHDRAGFTGTVTLRLSREATSAVQAGFGALVRFAEFCGTGAQTTHGFGATSIAAGAREPDG
jgi:hypothetical protein